jgi:hypothetical protein
MTRLRSGRPSIENAEYSTASTPATGCRKCFVPPPWVRTSFSRHCKPSDALPVQLHGAELRIKEYPAQDIALLKGECVIGKERRCSPIPRDEIPSDGSHKGWTELPCIQHALDPRRNAFLRLIADLRRMPQGDEEKMFALNVGQHQSPSDTFQHLSRRRAAASLFKPGVPGGADMSALSYFFAPQPGRSPSGHRKAECWTASRSRKQIVQSLSDSQSH